MVEMEHFILYIFYTILKIEKNLTDDKDVTSVLSNNDSRSNVKGRCYVIWRLQKTFWPQVPYLKLFGPK